MNGIMFFMYLMKRREFQETSSCLPILVRLASFDNGKRKGSSQSRMARKFYVGSHRKILEFVFFFLFCVTKEKKRIVNFFSFEEADNLDFLSAIPIKLASLYKSSLDKCTCPNDA